jgi:hypothetical protein
VAACRRRLAAGTAALAALVAALAAPLAIEEAVMNDLWRPTKLLKVHPLAAMFPMLGDDKLDELAADIKENGLLHPIVRMIDGETIVDGQNRYEACRRAGVEPTFDDRIKTDDEARALILSANISRRHLDKGQQAMATAILYPEPAKLRRKGSSPSKIEGLADGYISMARTVLRDRNQQFDASLRNGGGAPIDNVAGIMNGTVKLDSAYHEAVERERTATRRAERLTELRNRNPDLADQVEREEMSLSVAEAEARQRYEAWREARRSAFMDLSAVLTQAAGFAASKDREGMAGWLDVEEVETDFRHYFPGGIPQLLESASPFEAGTAALHRILFAFQSRAKR